MPYPGLLHPEPLHLCQATADPYHCRRPSDTILAQSLTPVSGSWCEQGLFEFSEHLWWVRGLILNMILPPNHLAGSSTLPLDMRYLFLMGSNIFLLMVVQQRVVILEFSQEISACSSTLLSVAMWEEGPIAGLKQGGLSTERKGTSADQ